MLTVTSLTNAEYVLSSVALGIDEYYTGVGEAPGVWCGSWAASLGLVGMVEADQLRSLVEGNDPSSQVRLLSGRERTVKAFDLTFSAPKSVSLLWALGSEPVADVVAAAHREAVAAALGFLEARAALARVQVDGVRRHVPTGGWVVAGFVHRTSRAGDPQLHTHCVVPNVVCREDGRCVAIAARPMFVWARAAGSVYQAELQRLLGLRLGVQWQADRSNTREIAGFDTRVLRAFSKRTVEIEAELAATGALYESPALRMRADDEASLATRPAKDHRATPQMLCGRWLDEAAEAGLAVGRDLDAVVCWRDLPDRALGFDEIARRLVDEETGLCAHDARFAEHDVIEHIAALAAGGLTVGEIVGLTDGFLASDLVCRLTPKPSASGWEPPRWSTVAQRRLEDDTIGLLDRLTAVAATPVAEGAVGDALAAAGLAADQDAAVRTLCGHGGAVRAVLAPAGYGKTAMAHVAAGCAASDGRLVVALATTSKAVAELEAAGLQACTIASFGLDIRRRLLPAGAVVVLDEISQTSTRDAHTVLAAVAACPGGQLWVLGDPHQAPAVKAGGIAAEIAVRAANRSLPAAELTVNRRQIDSTDRHALDLLRGGDPHASQQVRRDHGWEHTGATPAATREAMAAAVTRDVVRDGAENTVALVVSHAQAEDLADRIRPRLAAAGVLHGPSITGPGWTSDRDYRAGDRLLLHCRHGDRRSPLINGTVGTIAAVDHNSITFVTPRGVQVALPATFVTGTRTDGTPNVSHAWARTVDGAQGGTWENAHLLGTATLDAYRGYTAQSRSRRPTHTWNIATVPTVDFGGRLAHPADPDDQVVAALARVPDTTMAAVDDPWTLDRQLRDLIAAHQSELDRQPPDRQHALRTAHRDLESARVRLSAADDAIAVTRRQLDDVGPLAGLTRDGRARRRRLDDELDQHRLVAIAAAGEAARAVGRVARLAEEQAAHEQHQTAHGWRRDAIDQARVRLDQHWTDVALTCVRVDQPLAHGVAPLRIAHRHLTSQLADIRATIPPDRSRELDSAGRDVNTAAARRQQAQRRIAVLRQELDQHDSRHWPRRNRDAIHRCKHDLESAHAHLGDQVDVERTARRRLAELEQAQLARDGALSSTVEERRQLCTAIGQIEGALDRTRPERVLQLCVQSGVLHREVLGPVPTSAAGRAVWCHQAGRLEAHRDRMAGDETGWRRLVEELADTPLLAHIAERNIPVRALSRDQDTWRQVTQLATEIRTSAVEHAPVRSSRHVEVSIELDF